MQIIKNLIIFYLIIQLVSTAYGLSVIGTVEPIVEKKLKNEGYNLKNKNSLYDFNSKFSSFFKFFIPFYYARKALRLVEGNDPITRAAEEEKVTGNYTNNNDLIKFYDLTELEKDESLFIPKPKISFEKPEKYKAIKQKDNNLYNTYVAENEFTTKEMKLDEIKKLTPFEENSIHENIKSIIYPDNNLSYKLVKDNDLL